MAEKKSNIFSNGVTAGMLFILVLHLLGVEATQMVVRKGYEAISGKASQFSIGRIPDFDTQPEPVDIFATANENWMLVSQENDSLAFQDLAGQVIFINRWASWCGPCIAEMPDIATLIEEADGDAAFLLITDEGTSDFLAFPNHHALPLYRSVGRLPRALESGTIPATFIVDRQGIIRHKHIGKANWSDDSVRRYIENLNAEI